MADWDHQQRGVRDVLARHAAGVPSVCLSSPTGSGKTRMGQRLCEAWDLQNLRSVILTNRRLLTSQISKSLHHNGVRVGVQAAEFESWTDLGAPVQVCSIQTLLARVLGQRQTAIDAGLDPKLARKKWPLPPCDRLIIDECFVAGTPVETASGYVPIEMIVAGEQVANAIGYGIVTAVSKKTVRKLVTVEFEDGSALSCTANHPIFTSTGWVKAGALDDGAFVFGKEELCLLRSGVLSKTVPLEGGQRNSGGISVDQENMLWSVLCEEAEEPDAQPRVGGQSINSFEWSSASSHWREWSRSDVHAAGSVSGVGCRMGDGTQSEDWFPQGTRRCDDVQGGCCESTDDGCHRDRWRQSQFSSKQAERFQKGSRASGSRVVRVSSHESTTDVSVYNLQVSGHPSYIADGKLVHNCHLNSARVVQEMVSEWRELYGMQLVGLTATPLGVSHLCQELIVAGNNSELRACGALVPARLHMPKIFDMPKIRRSKTGLFTQEELNSQAKAIWSQHVVGHIYGSWKDLNPHALPALGMAPGRKESLGLAMEFYSHGVNAAHICSESIYVDGKLYQTTAQEDRDELFERSRTGEVPVIWNRFVMREGVDLPWLEHLMLATPIASLLSFIQVCGRVLRASPSTGKRNCVAEGSLVLTDSGLVAIEKVSHNHRLWDGSGWVTHSGVVCNGKRDVISYAGFSGTTDHRVWTAIGWRSLVDCRRLRLPIAQTGMGRSGVRVGESYRIGVAGSPEEWKQAGVRSYSVQRMREGFLGSMVKSDRWQDSWVSEVQHEGVPISEMVACSGGGPATAMHQREYRGVGKLRRSWDRVSLRIRGGWLPMDRGEPWYSGGSSAGSYRQQWSLRTRQPAVVNADSKYGSYPQDNCSRENTALPTEVPRGAVCRQNTSRSIGEDDRRTDCRALAQAVVQTEGRVWDILNAGPRNRFTVSGVLVHNCVIADHAGCIDLHGSPNADRDQDWQDYFYDKPDQITKDRIEKMTDPENTTPEFIVCPKCGMLRATGQQCPNCKFEHQQSVRLVIQENGKLRPVRGDYFRKRKIEVRSDTEKLWSQVYWQFKNAKKPLTFRQALAYFRKKHGYEPPKDLPGMPKDPLDLVRPVKFVSRDRLLKKEEPVVEVPRPKKKTLFSEEDL